MAVRNGTSGLFNEEYSVNNVIEGDTLYAGKVTPGGRWLVLRYVAATGVVDYANLSNNAGGVDYASLGQAVWDALQADAVTPGSFGAKLKNALTVGTFLGLK